MRASYLLLLAAVSALAVARATPIQAPEDCEAANAIFSSVHYDRTAPLAASNSAAAAGMFASPIGSVLGPDAVFSTNRILGRNESVADPSGAQTIAPRGRSGRNAPPDALDTSGGAFVLARGGRPDRAICPAGCPDSPGLPNGNLFQGGSAATPGADPATPDGSGFPDPLNPGPGVTATPEPVPFLLVGLGLISLGVLRRRSRS